jgi:hypothetical protein
VRHDCEHRRPLHDHVDGGRGALCSEFVSWRACVATAVRLVHLQRVSVFSADLLVQPCLNTNVWDNWKKPWRSVYYTPWSIISNITVKNTAFSSFQSPKFFNFALFLSFLFVFPFSPPPFASVFICVLFSF